MWGGRGGKGEEGRSLTLPQKTQVYRACCEMSIFLTCLRREAPYRVPYLPTTPAFLVRLAMVEAGGK